MSEAHAVASQLVRLSRAAPEDDQLPMLPPPKVTLLEPVAATFIIITALTSGFAAESPCVTDPVRTPADIADRQLPLAPMAAKLRTDVSDSHELCSARLEPPRAPTLVDRRPNPAPCTVKLLEPVDALLLRPTMLGVGDDADKR